MGDHSPLKETEIHKSSRNSNFEVKAYAFQGSNSAIFFFAPFSMRFKSFQKELTPFGKGRNKAVTKVVPL